MAKPPLEIIVSLCLVLLAKASVPNGDAKCNSSVIAGSNDRGLSILQIKSKSARIQRGAGAATEECQLPAGAVWCEVRLKNLPGFWMAVYDWNVATDWVSYNVCQKGHWEVDDIADYGTPGNMFDIGGNIGYYTLSFAHAGWNVTSFEPMEPNLALMGASLCRNPHLRERVHLNAFGLGTRSERCKMLAPPSNVGDGFTRCGDALDFTPRQPDENTFVEKGTFEIKRLDAYLQSQPISKVDLVKIDVEGYEYQVFAGAPNFLAQYRPRVVKSEVWLKMVGATTHAPGIDYLGLFDSVGYKFFRDSRCQIPMDAKSELQSNKTYGVINVFMCI